MTPWLQTNIQPSLLERLTDHSPQQTREPTAMALSLTQYRMSVERDLRWLLSTCAPPLVSPRKNMRAPSDYYLNPGAYAAAIKTAPPEARAKWIDLRRYPGVLRSVLLFGLRQVIQQPGAWKEQLTAEIRRILGIYEPRIIPETVLAVLDRQVLQIEIRGQLLAFPANRDFQLRLRVDRETCEVAII